MYATAENTANESERHIGETLPPQYISEATPRATPSSNERMNELCAVPR